MSNANAGRPLPRRPLFFDPVTMDAQAGAEALDPARVTEVAHETAAVIVRTGRAATDPALTAKLVSLVDDLGLSTLAELWADRPARSLPGALWRLYALREWVRRDPVGASADYCAGMSFADFSHVVAGVAEPPGPAELQGMSDAILTGVFDGDLAIALERAGAFCRVIAAGRAHRADEIERSDPLLGSAQTRRASSMLTTGEDLEACARLWRRDDLL